MQAHVRHCANVPHNQSALLIGADTRVVLLMRNTVTIIQ